MKITKLGHCCLIIEVKGKKILTDPGAYDYSRLPSDIKGISAVLITHEHSDHLHVESLKNLLLNNKEAVVITNTAVGKILEQSKIQYTKIEDKDSFDLSGIKINGFGDIHAEIYGTYGQVQNTGFMINDLCFPGDSFNKPNTKVDILALPVLGPWMKMKDAIDYAKELKPRVCFPVHDAPLKPFATFIYKIPEHFLSQVGISFKKLEINKQEDL